MTIAIANGLLAGIMLFAAFLSLIVLLSVAVYILYDLRKRRD